MEVRHATLADLPMVFALGERGYAESRYGRYPLRRDKFENLTNLAQQQPESVVCLVVAAANGDIAGFICGMITEHYFADMKYATNFALFVAPEFRGGSAALRLVRAFEREARDRGAHEILLGNTSGVQAERTLKLYEALGYARVGGSAVKYLGA